MPYPANFFIFVTYPAVISFESKNILVYATWSEIGELSARNEIVFLHESCSLRFKAFS